MSLSEAWMQSQRGRIQLGQPHPTSVPSWPWGAAQPWSSLPFQADHSEHPGAPGYLPCRLGGVSAVALKAIKEKRVQGLFFKTSPSSTGAYPHLSDIFLIFYGRFSRNYFVYTPPITSNQGTSTLA